MGYFDGLSNGLRRSVTKSISQAPPSLDAPASFEAALAEIENIVARMETGQLPLDESLSAYRRGAELLQYCQARLQEAQQQVKVLEAGTLQNLDGEDSAE